MSDLKQTPRQGDSSELGSAIALKGDAPAPSIRYRALSVRWRTVMAILTGASILLAINQVFNLGFFVGYVLLDSRYMYLITGVMLSMVFVTFPATKHSPTHVPWYDIVIMLVIAGVF